MSEYDTEDTEPDSEEEYGPLRGTFASLPNIKSNTPRARFDVYFFPTFIRLIQYNTKKEVSMRYRISNDNMIEMLRLPYNHGIFFVLHLQRPIVGGNRGTTKYDFVVFNFTQDECTKRIKLKIDRTKPGAREMFDKGTVEGTKVDIFETVLEEIFRKQTTLPAANYEDGELAPALRCTFWDNDEHFLFPLDDGFVNVWKYCQKLKLHQIKNVRFVRSQGRQKTFDFYVYPTMNRSIRRYDIGAGRSNTLQCFFLEFKAIDQVHYDRLLDYCCRNKITINTNDFRQSASDTDSGGDGSEGGEAESQTPTDALSSLVDSSEDGDDRIMSDDVYEAPDPHLASCQREGRGKRDESSSSNSDESDASVDEHLEERVTTSPETVDTNTKQRRRTRSRNVITTSDSDSSGPITPKRRSLPRKPTIDDDEEEEEEDNVGNGVAKKRSSVIIDSD